jgi:hypothetical protein
MIGCSTGVTLFKYSVALQELKRWQISGVELAENESGRVACEDRILRVFLFVYDFRIKSTVYMTDIYVGIRGFRFILVDLPAVLGLNRDPSSIIRK